MCFRFIKNPEYLREGMRLVFREGRTKAVGNVVLLHPHVSATAQNLRGRERARKEGGVAERAGGRKDGVVRPQNEPQKPSKKTRGVRREKDDEDGAGDGVEVEAEDTTAVVAEVRPTSS